VGQEKEKEKLAKRAERFGSVTAAKDASGKVKEVSSKEDDAKKAARAARCG